MMDKYNYCLEGAIKTIDIEIKAMEAMKGGLDQSLINSLKLIHESAGKVVVTGIGKSAIIGQKMVATFNSTGTTAAFLHAADAIHGDLGMIEKQDVVIAISKSGNTEEIKVLAPLIKALSVPMIAITSKKDSALANYADQTLWTPVEEEACPNNLAPTTSTTLQLAMGDVLAVELMNLSKFGSADFAKYHPGGALGKRLYLKVLDLLKDEELPLLSKEASFKEVLLAISKYRKGAVAIVENGSLLGLITDGDVRRNIHSDINWQTIKAVDIMTANPCTIEVNDLAIAAFQKMEEKAINQIVVLDKGSFKGIVHLHEIIKEGIF